MTPTSPYKSRSLAQSLAVQTQVHLAGTVGRLLKQIRDLERVAPLFIEARLVRAVDRPNPLTVNVAGISTRRQPDVAGGFLYAQPEPAATSASTTTWWRRGVRTVCVKSTTLSTRTSPSVSIDRHPSGLRNWRSAHSCPVSLSTCSSSIVRGC
jgi:hypothetical protein